MSNSQIFNAIAQIFVMLAQQSDELGVKYTAGIKDDKRKVRGFIGVGFTVRG